MKNLALVIVGAILGTAFYACSMGSKTIKYSNFPIRSKQFSVWMKCKDGDKENVCKYICTKYKKNNQCKKGHDRVDKIEIDKALDNGWVLISKSYFLQLIRSKK